MHQAYAGSATASISRWRGGAFALFPLLLFPACAVESPTDEDVGKGEEAIHVNKTCAVATLGFVNAISAALSRYGNWCGPNLWGNANEALGDRNGRTPLPPVNCWDAACRVHDYAFGRPLEGFKSCHGVLDKAGVPAEIATPCIADADRNLCAQWSKCSDKAVETRALTNRTWIFRSVPGSKPAIRERVCRDNPRKMPQICDWISQPGDPVYTCDPTLCPPRPQDEAVSLVPAPGCAVEYSVSQQEAVAECCAYLPPDQPRPRECPQCKPTTCFAAGASCGPIADGCGGTLDCGVCGGSETSGGARQPMRMRPHDLRSRERGVRRHSGRLRWSARLRQL